MARGWENALHLKTTAGRQFVRTVPFGWNFRYREKNKHHLFGLFNKCIGLRGALKEGKMDYDHLDPEGSLMDVRRISIVSFNLRRFLEIFLWFSSTNCLLLPRIVFSIIYSGFKPWSSLLSLMSRERGWRKLIKKLESKAGLLTTTTVIAVAKEVICSAVTDVRVLFTLHVGTFL